MKISKIYNFKFSILNSQPAFTVIELLTVVFIMGLMATLITANLGGQRDSRNMTIAQNQLVSDIRKIQSYTLSSRKFNNQDVQFYVLKVDAASPSQYTIQAMYNVDTAPQLVTVETDKLPDGIQFSNVTINGTPASCSLLSFSTPFAKALMSTTCNPGNPTLPYAVGTVTPDTYQDILNYISNTGLVTTYGNGTMVFNIATTDGSALAKSVIVNGITGLVSFQ